jgi:hypothetical protein
LDKAAAWPSHQGARVLGAEVRSARWLANRKLGTFERSTVDGDGGTFRINDAGRAALKATWDEKKGGAK